MNREDIVNLLGGGVPGKRCLGDDTRPGTQGPYVPTGGGWIGRAAAGELVLPAGDVAGVLSRLREAQRACLDAQGLLSLLTSREIQILQLTAEGRSTPQVAQELFISPFTVQTLMKNILAKLGVHSKLEAVAFCIRRGAIRIAPESQLPPSG